MDETTRGIIESQIDTMLNNQIIPEIAWIQNEMPVSSLKDFAIGYVMGAIKAAAISFAAMRAKPTDTLAEAENAIMKIIRRRLPEIVERVNKELDV